MILSYMILEFNGIPIEISKKAIKNLSLRIYPPDGTVKISAPLKFSDEQILKFLQQKSAWIEKNHHLVRSRSTLENTLLQSGATIPFMGKNYLLIIENCSTPPDIKLQDEFIYCYIPVDSSQEQIQGWIDNWYRCQMKLLLPDLIQHWSKIVGVNVYEWGIKKMKTRWGSCNTKVARIWLNLNLMKKPQECLEYVLVHELVHLHEPSHNQRFYRLMTQFMPQWRDHQYLLEKRQLNK